MTPDPQWLVWAKEFKTMAQTGLTYARDPYDIERYQRMQAIAFEMLATQSGEEFVRIKELFVHETGHATPKVDVRAAVFRGDTIMLVRERSDRGWTLPGGWADVGESPSEAIAREVWEESGFEVRVTRLLALHDKAKHPHPPQAHYVYKIFFECEIIGGSEQHSAETDGVSFFAAEDLPPLSLDRVLPEQIIRLFELYRDRQAPTDFD